MADHFDLPRADPLEVVRRLRDLVTRIGIEFGTVQRKKTCTVSDTDWRTEVSVVGDVVPVCACAPDTVRAQSAVPITNLIGNLQIRTGISSICIVQCFAAM